MQTIEQILQETASSMSTTDVVRWLYRYGYFNGIVDSVEALTFNQIKQQIKRNMPEFREAVTRMQLMHGLQADSEPGPETQQVMSRPRCGHPDVLPEGVAAVAGDSRWPVERMPNGITYAGKFQGLNVTNAQAVESFKNAAAAWSAVCGASLVWSGTYGQANINAKAGLIDTSGQTLAWSYFPNGQPDHRLTQLYDTAERWSITWLVAVMIHELGHALGWQHLGDRTSIMYAYSNPDVVEPSQVDIKRAVKTYGLPTETPETPGQPAGLGVSARGTIKFTLDGREYAVPMSSTTKYERL